MYQRILPLIILAVVVQARGVEAPPTTVPPTPPIQYRAALALAEQTTLQKLEVDERLSEVWAWVDFIGPAGQVAHTLAEDYHIPHDLARRLINLESGGRTNLISVTNDYGLMQLNISTWPWLARRVGLDNPDPLDPEDNLRMGFWYLDYLHTKYVDWDTTLTAYNRGEGGLREYIASRGTSRSDYSRRILEGN